MHTKTICAPYMYLHVRVCLDVNYIYVKLFKSYYQPKSDNVEFGYAHTGTGSLRTTRTKLGTYIVTIYVDSFLVITAVRYDYL